FGPIERDIGARDQRIDIGNDLGRGGGADADGGADLDAGDFDPGGFEAGAHTLGDHGGDIARLVDDRGKFLAAESADDVASAHALADRVGERAQRLVADI